MSTTTPATPLTLTVRNPGDVLAAIPRILGFHPERSLVAICLNGDRKFNARVDYDTENARDQAAALIEPAHQHRVTQMLLVIYTPGDWSTCFDNTLAEFTEAGINVPVLIHANGTTWATDYNPAARQPYQLEDHPFVLDAVYDDVPIHTSRAALVAHLAPAPGADGLLPALYAAGTRPATPTLGALEAIRDLVLHLGVVSDTRLVELIETMHHPLGRDAACWATQRPQATGTTSAERVTWWSHLVSRVPADPRCDDLLSVAAFGTWQAGGGATAWAVLDRLTGETPLGGLVTQALAEALPPQSFDGITWGDAVTHRLDS